MYIFEGVSKALVADGSSDIYYMVTGSGPENSSSVRTITTHPPFFHVRSFALELKGNPTRCGRWAASSSSSSCSTNRCARNPVGCPNRSSRVFVHSCTDFDVTVFQDTITRLLYSIGT